jgi:two-component system response regulator DegU
MSIKIILADDHDVIRQTQRYILETESDFEITGEACNGREVLRLVEQLQPDIVIMDINMPEKNGIEATCKLHQSHPAVKVIGYSLHATEPMILSMLYAGAMGYVSKKCPADELSKAIRKVLKGEIYISPHIRGVSIDGMGGKDPMENSMQSAKLAIG